MNRIPCCIVGCRRTFKRDVHPGSYDVMCGKHYRADKSLVAQRRRIEMLMRRLNTIHRRWARKNGGDITGQQIRRLDATWNKLDIRRQALWVSIKANAQNMQDTGYWAPRPRVFRKRASNEGAKSDMPKVVHSFEAEFQRLKRQMGEPGKNRR